MFKGKVKSVYKILIFALAIVTAIVCVAFSFRRDNPAYAVINYDHNEFSAVDEDTDAILSVEKVYAISTGNFELSDGLSDDSVFKEALYANVDANEGLSSMYVQGNNKYYYSNIAENGNSKYVVRNGDFVMLNNQVNANNTYYTPNFSAYNADREVQNMQEAIMVSFGQYYFTDRANNEFAIAGENEGAEIQTINVVARRNGEVIQLPAPRNYDDNMYEDFVCIIPQSQGNEGYYEFTFTYFYGGISYTQTFSFYVLFNTSYNSSYQSSATNNTYSTVPSLENAQLGNNNVYEYFIGKYNQNLNYPTLTFDYTKYDLSYTHTANGVVTTYDYEFVTNTTVGNTSGRMIETVTSFGESATKTYYLDNYNSLSNGLNFVTFVFTEAGNYNFSFDYIYAGFNSESMPEMNLSIPEIDLVISGFEMKYSLTGKQEAGFRYLTISASEADHVDLIVPNGYVRDQVPSDSIVGVIYSLDNNPTSLDNSTPKVGSVVSSEDPSLNYKIESADLKDDLQGVDEYVFNYLYDSLNSRTPTLNADVQTILSYIRDNNFYVKTNQGSIWATSNDNFNSSGSFYYYSTQPIVVTENEAGGYSISGTRYNYLNTTTFTRTGYYLLFINVDVNGGGDDYNQIFAFQYTTDTININASIVEDSTGSQIISPIGSGQYTNKYVQVSWQEPGVFERRITANYYSVTNQYLTRNELLSTAPIALSNGQVLGTNLGTSEGATYLIELLSEGRSASYHIFTIDRTPIQQIGAYAVERVATANNSISYEFMSINGNNVRLTNSITSSLATLYWDDKASGANITATYTFTPFVRNSSITVGEIYSSSSAVWFNTNYELGTTVGSFDIEKASSLGSEVSYTNVLYRQGIYVFTLVDGAGNSAKFMFIIDNTENFFRLTSGDETLFATASSQIFSESVNVEVGTHKAVSLDNLPSNGDITTIIQLLASNASNNELARVGYYVQSDTNIDSLKSLFGTVQGSYYLTVRNNSLSSRTSENVTDSGTSISNITVNNRQTTINYEDDVASTSTIRTLYLVGENQRYTTFYDVTNSNSYVVVEVNVDNSRGTVYYSNNIISSTQISSDGNISEGSNIYRLLSGSDVLNADDSIQLIGIDGAHATSENYLAFVWNMGTGRYEVSSITYDYYSLNLSEDSYNDNWVLENGRVENIHYYNYIRTTTLYSDGTAQNGTEILEDGRGFALLNVENSRTLEGLYVIRREYHDTGEDLGQDELVQTYYVIVDRNGIIDQNNEHIGGYINLGLKEDETEFTEFNTINTETGYFSYAEGGNIIYQNKAYSVYLTSDKLPITLNIPIAKYFGGSGETGSTYYAGRLSFEFYFRDTQNQLSSSRGDVVKLFEIDSNDFDTASYVNGIYSIDLRGYLTRNGENASDVGRIIRSINDTDWICLLGDYIVVIKDMVESSGSTGAHEKVIGFRIEHSEVEADVYSVPERDMTTEDSQNVATRTDENTYRLVTSEEFVKLDMAEYIEESTRAGLDLNYLVVTQNLNGYTTNYINHQYGNINGTYRLDDSNPSVVENVYDSSSNLVSRVIYLNTYLRDSNGNINLDNITQTLSYEITLRFRLANTSGTIVNDRFINCYYYYDNEGNLQTYYEAKITVIIDRVAPTNNIDYLMENDALVDYYVADNGEDMFESSYIETNSNVYFVNRYKTYYGTGDNSTIYTFRVENTTPFNNTNRDITSIYFREIPDISAVSLSLPAITNLSIYTQANNIFDIQNYAGLLPGESSYYEILEMDEAGNTTQYVVFYDAVNEGATSTPNDDLVLEFNSSMIDSSGAIDDEAILTISNANNGETFTIFDISIYENYEGFYGDVYDRYYRISLSSNNSESESYILTNATTDFSNSGLMNDIVNLIQTAGEGNYTLRVETRTGDYQVTLNYYDYNNRISLNIENLVEVVNGNYQINLQGANVSYEGIMYYASRIEITHNGETNTYICRPSNGVYNYYLNGDIENGVTQVLTGLNGTYQIRMTDAFGEVYTYRFNTTGADFYSISFGENEDANYYEFSNTYYAFDQVNIDFDSSIFTVRATRVINDSARSEYYTFSSTNNSWSYLEEVVASLGESGNVLYLYPYYTTNNGQYSGAKISFTIDFILEDGTIEYSYRVVLDSRIGMVNLTTNNLSQSMSVAVNADYRETISEYITSGTSYLSWNVREDDILSYSYTLYELKSNGEYVSTDLNSQSSFVISTPSDSDGLYKFVIEVLSPTGQVLGNIIYTFQVLQNSSELYYVTLPDNSIAEVNSSFRFNEIRNELTTERLNQLGVQNIIDLPSANVDLYVYNTNLRIQHATDKGVTLASVSIPVSSGNYQFTIYRAYTDTYSLYFATLIVANNSDFISSVAVTQNSNTETLATSNRFSFTYVGASSDVFSLIVTPNIPSNLQTNAIVAKNSLVLEVYLNDEFVNFVNLNNNNSVGTFRLLGNGRYTIVFKDLAGNTHTFTTSLGSQQNSLDISILKEPVTMVNDMAPIDNAYYNGNVVVSVYNPATYDIGSINLTATRNGVEYTPIKSQYNYTFLDYGTYRVVVTATYTDSNQTTHNLRKVLVFTIINPNEARESIDLTSLGGFEIVSVLHGDRDITDLFNEMFNQNASGRLLTYNMLLNYREELNISSGKQVFTITYRVEDEVYPTREVSFTFTMNNEIPNIFCSLDTGETTTSGFTISFNPGIIYEQVGEALIYVNDSLIYSINETSPLVVLSLEIREDQYGAGDYYVRLETASGQVITSFKAVIEEPLNAWAIVIIVVVSVIVIAVIVTIILLRRRMRIR